MVLVNPASALVLAMQIMLSGFFNNRESLFRWVGKFTTMTGSFSGVD